MPRQQVYPVSLLLRDRPCLVVGGGQVARSKIEGLLDAGASVTVIAPEITAEIAGLPVAIHRRPYHEGDCAGFVLVIAATGIGDLDADIFAECQRTATLVNAADNPAACSFYLPALLRAGDLSVAISTAGASPAVASWVRNRVGELIGDHFADVVGIVGTTREEIRARGRTSEGLAWEVLIEQLNAAFADGGDLDAARTLAAKWIAQVIPGQVPEP